MRIFKQVLAITGNVQEFTVPVATKGRNWCMPLHVAVQDGHICVWYTAPAEEDYDPENVETRHALIVGTGHEFPHYRIEHYVGTVHMGAYVWHVFWW